MSADVVTDEFTILLRMMAERCWTFAYYPDRVNIERLAAVFEHRAQRVADVAIMTRPGYAYGYRGILTASPDPFAPNFVSWTYSDQPVHVFRASLALPAPGLQGAPLGHRSVPTHLTEAAEPFVRNRGIRPPQSTERPQL